MLLTKPKVTLISASKDPLFSMALAAKLCYFKGNNISELIESLKDNREEQEKVLKHCIEHRHLSVLEHSFFMFAIEGVGRNFTHQLVRHRNTSYEQQSLHFIKAKSCNIAAPSNINAGDADIMETVADHCFDAYNILIEHGMAKEDARHILPSGIETKIVASANLRQWQHFIKLRECKINCEEIQVVATQIRLHIQNIIPFMADYLGPNCKLHGICIEGKKFCGAPRNLPLVLKEGANKLSIINNKQELEAYGKLVK